MKKISWISCDGFIDTDLPIIVRLQHYYRIRFILTVSYNNSIDYLQMINNELGEDSKVEVVYVKQNDRLKSLKNIPTYLKIVNSAKSFNADIYYISFQGMPYALPLYKLLLPISKCVVPCHNVSTPAGATNEKLAKWTTKWWIGSFKNINVFSLSQKQLLESSYSNKNILYTPFYLKDYGSLKKNLDKMHSKPICFLAFGNIVRYKRIDLLIEAANILVERGVKGFVVRVAGNCKNWEDYERLIKYPEQFQLMIRRIPNEDIVDLFEDAHYFVLPYQDIAQSGSITVAFNYNVPTIVSDIPQFHEFVESGKTGLTFESRNATSLANVMQYCIEQHDNMYEALCKNQRVFIHEHYTEEIITKNYLDYFGKIV